MTDLSLPTPAPATKAMTVPLLDLKAQYQTLKAEVLPVIEAVCESQGFILGPYVRELEAKVAAYSGAAHGIGVSSGTDALLLALMALNIGPGDEVITSPYSFFATAGTVARLGARPVFVDIDPLTYNLSAPSVQQFIDESCDFEGGVLRNRRTGGRVRVLMPVHLYGQCADMSALMSIAQANNLKVIEDAAQAIGSEHQGARAGSFGDIGCFSFFPSKNLGAFGDAGLCTARDPELAAHLGILRVHGGAPKYYHSFIGGNFRIDELQAAILCVKLAHLDAWSEARARNAASYNAAFAARGLSSTVTTPYAVPGSRHIYNQYVIRVPFRDQLKQYLQDSGIGCEIYYPVPLHQQACFASLGYQTGDCPHAEAAALQTLALPAYPELMAEQQAYVVDTISRFYA